ncbi:MAG: hypothetical protein FWG79_09060 [Bacteroidales bacterium]|nr:hypothetical protein [Bacteroidales bacterium]
MKNLFKTAFSLRNTIKILGVTAMVAAIGFSSMSCKKENEVQGLRLLNQTPALGGRVTRIEIHNNGTSLLGSSTLIGGYTTDLTYDDYTEIELEPGTYRLRVLLTVGGFIPVEYNKKTPFTVNTGKATRVTFKPDGDDWESAL